MEWQQKLLPVIVFGLLSQLQLLVDKGVEAFSEKLPDVSKYVLVDALVPRFLIAFEQGLLYVHFEANGVVIDHVFWLLLPLRGTDHYLQVLDAVIWGHIQILQILI